MVVSCDTAKSSPRDNSSIGGSTDNMEMPRSTATTPPATARQTPAEPERANTVDRARTPRTDQMENERKAEMEAKRTEQMEGERLSRTDMDRAKVEADKTKMAMKRTKAEMDMEARTEVDQAGMDAEEAKADMKRAKADMDRDMQAKTDAMKMDLPRGEMYRTMSVKEDLPSPRRKMQAELAGSKIMVDYGSPSMNKRELYGKLVPYGQVWRSGANEATTVTFDKDVLVEGKMLKAGTYALFTIPEQDEWTVIFSKTAEQWGAYKYDMKDDALRVKVKPRAAAKSTEQLYYGAAKDELNLNWGDKVVPIKVTERIVSQD